MLKFDYLVKYRDFYGAIYNAFCFGRKNVQLEIVKINSELLKIKKIKQSQKAVVQAKFKAIYVKIWQKILLLMQTEPGLRVHSNYVAILQLILNRTGFVGDFFI
jgi:hypothetical protein